MILTSLAALVFLAGSAPGQDITAANTSRYIGSGKWEWTVFVKAPSDLLNEIRHVEYKLHPTFPNPNRKVESMGDRDYPFGLTATGWGTFDIDIKVTFKSGKSRRMKHTLAFTSPPVRQPLPITADNVATPTNKNRWRWTVFVKGPEDALAKIQCVEYTLHPTFFEPVQEMCERGEGPQAFALSAVGWGTFEIKIRVFLKDGTAQELTHQLKF
jgi:transcription initiation factor IIF auxiliary subunit